MTRRWLAAALWAAGTFAFGYGVGTAMRGHGYLLALAFVGAAFWVLAEMVWARRDWRGPLWRRRCGSLEPDPEGIYPRHLLYTCDRARGHRGGHRYGARTW